MEQINAVLKQLWDRGLLEKGPAHSEYGPGVRLSNRGWEVFNDPSSLRRLCNSAANLSADDGPNQDPQRAAEVIGSLRSRKVAYVSWVLLGLNFLVFFVGLYLANQAGVPLAYLGGTKTLYAAAVFVVLFVAFNVRPFAQYFNGMMRIVILIGVMYLAQRYQLFIFPVGGPADAIRHQCGLLSASDWLRGEWWRTLTACFVHLGLLHLLGNMLMLYSGGWFIERMWGSGRYLVIYLLAGITGSLTGLAATPGGIAGASGALCGLIAAEAVWVLFNGKYLPRRMQQEWWNNLSLNFVLLAGISYLVPGISIWGHAGGALAGAAAAVCLHYQRFGSPQWRWAALLGLFPIPLAGLYYLNHERQTQNVWQRVEKNDFEEGYKYSLAHPLTKAMAAEFAETVRPVLVNTRASRRTDEKIEAALTVLEKQRKELESWREQLTNLGPYVSKEVKEERQQALDAVTARLDLYERAEKSLREGENYPQKDETKLLELLAATPELQTAEERQLAEAKKREEARDHPEEKDDPVKEAERRKKEQQQEAVTQFAKKQRKDIAERLNKAQKLFDSDLSKDLSRDPAEWHDATVKNSLAAIKVNRVELEKLVDRLPTLGPFPTEEISTEVERATIYATELDKLLSQAQQALLARDNWTAAEKAALEKQRQKVKQVHDEWVDAQPDAP